MNWLRQALLAIEGAKEALLAMNRPTITAAANKKTLLQCIFGCFAVEMVKLGQMFGSVEDC